MPSVTFIKVRRVWREGGVGAVARRVGARIRDILVFRKAVAALQPSCTSEEMVHAVFSDELALVRPFQVPAEILRLVQDVRALEPKVVVEIGTANGGTLLLWTRVAAPDALVISIDLPGGEFGDGYGLWRRLVYRSFATSRQRVELLQMDSHASRTVKRVRELLAGRPIDFLFIDGDHSYAGVRQDFAAYGELVRPGGLVALHDIAPPLDPAIGVRRFWTEIAGSAGAREYIGAAGQLGFGIGVIVKQPSAA